MQSHIINQARHMKKILIIDDENRTRQLIAKMIESFGLNVETIPEGENVQSGIEAINKHNPDIVFLDIQMPDGTGFDVLVSIPNKTFEVIFITAHEEFAIKAIMFSALDYLLKPVDTTELRSALERALIRLDERPEPSQFDALQKNIQPSERGELEITSVNQIYLQQQNLKLDMLGRGFTWLDTGTHDSLLEAGQFIETIEKRQGLKVACLEEIAFRMNYINAQQVRKLAEPLEKNGYGQYLLNFIK